MSTARLDERLAALFARLESAEAALETSGPGPAHRLANLETEMAVLCGEAGALDTDARRALLPRLEALSQRLGQLEEGVARRLAALDAKLSPGKPGTSGAG